MVDKRDQQFFDGFMLLVGIFAGTIAGIILLGDLIGEGEPAAEGDESSAIIERIQPVGQVALIGDPSLDAAPVAPAAPAAPAGESLSGEQVYEQTCSLCHAAGVGGAPMLSDSAAWAPRVEQGRDVLREHVINGFQGDAGVMPPKGGRADLTDDQVVAAMQYMLDQVGQ